MLTHAIKKLAETTPEFRALLVPLLKTAAKGWDQFLAEKYDGGKRKVSNPNPDTQKKYPEVTVSTAMRDPAFKERILKEYHVWMGAGKDKEPRGQTAPATEKFLKPYEYAGMPDRVPSKLTEPGEYETYMEQMESAVKSFASKHLIKNRDLSPTQKEKVERYTNQDFKSVNAFLRSGSKHRLPPGLATQVIGSVKALDSFFDSKASSLPVAVKAVRGVSSGPFLDLLESGSAAIGSVIQDNGYSSTSLLNPDGYEFSQGINVIINVPKGAKALYVGPPGPISKHPQEYELIIDRGAKYKVLSVDLEKRTCEVELLPQEGKEKLEAPATAEKASYTPPAAAPASKVNAEQVFASKDYKVYSSDATSAELENAGAKAFKKVPLGLDFRVDSLDFVKDTAFSARVKKTVRSGTGSGSDVGFLEDLQSKIEASETLEDLELAVPEFEFQDTLADAKDGDTVSFNFGTAALAHKEQESVVIRIPKGSRALFLAPPNGSASPWGPNVVLPYGAKFQVQHKGGKTIAVMLTA